MKRENMLGMGVMPGSEEDPPQRGILDLLWMVSAVAIFRIWLIPYIVDFGK